MNPRLDAISGRCWILWHHYRRGPKFVLYYNAWLRIVELKCHWGITAQAHLNFLRYDESERQIGE